MVAAIKDTAQGNIIIQNENGFNTKVLVEFDIKIEYDEQTNQYCVECPLTSSQGKTIEEAKKNIVEAFELYWESCDERGVLEECLNLHKVRVENLDGKYKLVEYDPEKIAAMFPHYNILARNDEEGTIVIGRKRSKNIIAMTRG